MISFVYPHLLWLFGTPLLVFSFFILRHKSNFLDIFDEKVLERLSRGEEHIPLYIRNILVMIAGVFIIIALARPIVDKGKHTIYLEGLSVVVALDISGSMRATDLYPNRLEFAKQKIVDLLEKMPSDELSIIAFAHSSFFLAPFSSDKASLSVIVEGINDKYINMSSTDFQVLGIFSKKILAKKDPKILLVFSDGGEKKELESFAKIIKQEHIFLYSVLMGTKEGSPVIDSNGKVIHQNGQIVLTQRNDYLGEISKESGGAFVVAENGENDLEYLLDVMKKNHQNREQGEVTIHDTEEYFYYPLALALFLLLLSLLSLPSFEQRRSR